MDYKTMPSFTPQQIKWLEEEYARVNYDITDADTANYRAGMANVVRELKRAMEIKKAMAQNKGNKPRRKGR